jgi:hypothetical protein
MANVKITKENLGEKSFTNLEVLEMLSNLSMKLDMCGYSRALDLMEDLTGDRDFVERNCNF